MAGVDKGLQLRVRRLAQQTADQHQQLAALQREVEAALASEARADARSALERFTGALAAHFELEQGVVFPALHGLEPARGAELTALEQDHVGFLSDLRELLAQVDTAACDATLRGFDACMAALRQHEHREERLVNALAG